MKKWKKWKNGRQPRRKKENFDEIDPNLKRKGEKKKEIFKGKYLVGWRFCLSVQGQRRKEESISSAERGGSMKRYLEK